MMGRKDKRERYSKRGGVAVKTRVGWWPLRGVHQREREMMRKE